MSNFVFVIDAQKRPLTPIHPGFARRLLKQKQAAIYRKFPFTLILEESRPDLIRPHLKIKIDPGSRVTGFAILNGAQVIWAAELTHRGQAIKDALLSRRQLRRGRRNRHTRYRQPRFLNRTGPRGWLAPSLEHRVLTTLTWVNKLIKLAPIGSIAQELVRFDLQQLENPEISGIEYQQGTLLGYEVREYILDAWDRKCAYCGSENIPLQVEHIHPKAKGGTNRISNLCLACDSCNKKKDTQKIEQFLAKKPDVLKRIQAQRKRPLKDAAAVNSTRWALFNQLNKTELPVTTGSGGQTKFNRTRLQLPKCHWLDAASVGKVEELKVLTSQPLLIKATGHGSRQMCGTDKFGFPIRHKSRKQIHFGFQTGDIISATVTAGKKVGSYVGRALCRASGSFDIATTMGRVAGISHKYCKPIHKKDGYSYGF
ncbi:MULTISPECIES: RNA-guided endonuclease IscB [unclassified Microcoleus]|uniref:RNA-guided endonuclease IscB n=1 Tax=unclassified Microcoleus TaxID=2642155 RepID=UPI002FCE8ECF